MARNLNALVLALLAVATMIHGSSAQIRHVVGDAMGWTIPPGGATAYTNWAANKTFTSGDSLVFNFANGAHDVAKVTKAAFDACNTGSTIFTITSSPASVTLNETGEQYYICTFGSHCSLGQKLAINVSGAAFSPAPQPASAPPTTSPVPAPAPQTTTPPPPRAVPAPAPAPSSTATPPSSTATPPSAATPPSTTATPPPSTATPPSTSTSPPPPSPTTPSSPSPTGAVSPPPQNSASIAAAGVSATLLSIAAAFLY